MYVDFPNGRGWIEIPGYHEFLDEDGPDYKYEVQFADNRNYYYACAGFDLMTGEDLFDKLAEVLFVMQELIPQHINWKNDLDDCRSCLFKCEDNDCDILVTVTYDPKKCYFEVRDR